ncbi:hypothetical protein CEW46_23960 [Bacillus cereus]|nr:hypothetical protein CEW46_23960 [Bacillus cereus]
MDQPIVLSELLVRKSSTYLKVSDMLNDQDISEGLVITQGYYAPNDGGGASYIIKQSSLPEVTGLVFNLVKSGLQAHLVVEGELNVKQLGAKGNGVTDDTKIIQSALNLGKTLGKLKLYIPDGDYKLTAILRFGSNTHIRMNRGTRLVRHHNSSFFVNGEFKANYTLDTGNSNITVEGGTLEGNILQYPDGFNVFGLGKARNLTFRDIEIRDVASAHAFDLNDCHDVLIDNCRFLGYKDSTTDQSRGFSEAIQISNHTALGFSDFGEWDAGITSNVTVQNCYFGASGTTGTVAWAAGLGNHGSVYNLWNSDVKVINNTFDGCSFAGVRLMKFADTIITGNLFNNCERAISFSNPDGGGESAKDKDGVVWGLPQSGYNLSISNNIFRGTQREHLYIVGWEKDGTVAKVNSIIIKGNIFESQSQTSVASAFYFSFVNDMMFSNNIIKNVYRGVYLMHSSDIFIENNKFENCTNEALFLNEDAKYNGRGYLNSVWVRNNVIRNTGRVGIFMQFVTQFDVSGNMLYQTSTEVDNNRNAITVGNACTNGELKFNKVRKASSGNTNRYGIEVTGTCSNVRVYANDLEGVSGAQSLGGSNVYASSFDNSIMGKKANFLGDSITQGVSTTKTYWQYFCEKYGLIGNNYGITGTNLAGTSNGNGGSMLTRYPDMDATADLIIVYGGTNDFRNNITLGTMADRSNSTFYGSLHLLMDGLLTKYPNKGIGFITPLNFDRSTNTSGATLKQYVQAIIEVGEYYSIPVFNLYANSGIIATKAEQKSAYLDASGLHPNAAGHLVLEKRMESWMKSLI